MRLQWKDFAKARRKDVNLVRLLPECRTLERAQVELNWIQQEFIMENNKSREVKKKRIAQACIRRGKGFPLQYVLGNQPFAHMNILCRPKVLIPRRETEEWTIELGELFLRNWNTVCSSNHQSSINVVDVGTGTGCILIGLAAILSRESKNKRNNNSKWRFLGFDLDPVARSLAQSNLRLNRHLLNEDSLVDAIAIKRFNLFHFSLAQRLLLQFKSWQLGQDFTHQEIISSPLNLYESVATNTLFPKGKPTGFFSSVIPRNDNDNDNGHVDLIVSNPPYISSSDYHSVYNPTSINRSARKFESKSALLGGLDYYNRICGLAQELSMNKNINNQVKAIIMEVSGDDQMNNVIDIVNDMNYSIEWRPVLTSKKLKVDENWKKWHVGGWRDSSGNARLVVAWRSPWDWMSNFVNI